MYAQPHLLRIKVSYVRRGPTVASKYKSLAVTLRSLGPVTTGADWGKRMPRHSARIWYYANVYYSCSAIPNSECVRLDERRRSRCLQQSEDGAARSTGTFREFLCNPNMTSTSGVRWFPAGLQNMRQTHRLATVFTTYDSLATMTTTEEALVLEIRLIVYALESSVVTSADLLSFDWDPICLLTTTPAYSFQLWSSFRERSSSTLSTPTETSVAPATEVADVSMNGNLSVIGSMEVPVTSIGRQAPIDRLGFVIGFDMKSLYKQLFIDFQYLHEVIQCNILKQMDANQLAPGR
ncbi:hypothetical protein T265_11463 [Opisthorchis viverrini]|uniref:Uncharacterized protein n=1 Tax=Opisthorchis viverrini TaxID=6198 RepID=A0A074ZXE4_OPIVI|nr:hypothetical protein T265_11463 [Opisthorchis viverrini]KER19869.1 hypothetical protein T265_11463 [Opisthorchis viverrini]